MRIIDRLSSITGMAGVLALLAPFCQADPGSLTIGVDRPGARISPMLYGLMTEEINHSYDGGLYGELIQNRAFKDSTTRAVHWDVVSRGGAGEISLDRIEPVSAAAGTSLRFAITSAGADSKIGVSNDGYWGIPVRPSTRYRVSFYARSGNKLDGPLTVALETSDGKTTRAEAAIGSVGPKWRRYSCTLTTSGGFDASAANRFVIYASTPGTLWLSEVSLFPPTFNNRANGNRIDLMQKLGAMKPAFLRLPGGNYLEGDTFTDRFAWKTTLGSILERPGHQCPWGYRSSDGMGLLEYLEWCEDLKMEPILAVFGGYVLRGQHVSVGPELQPYVDEALEEIEYAIGDTSTKWGAIRKANGHPNPFKIEYVEIGNEDIFDRSGSYNGRFAQFYDAIRAKYPGLKIIATMPVGSRTPDVVDDHYYRSAAEMERDSHHYDNYPRTGPKIFVGEWASTEGSPTPTLQAALGDAAWMTGMERNSDLIPISCYAPLLVNVNPGARQWGTNLIGYDAVSSFGSASYYVQAMFGNNRGDVVLPVTIKPQAIAAPVTVFQPHGSIGLGTWETRAEFKDIKVQHGNDTLFSSSPSTGLDGWTPQLGEWHATTDGNIRQSQLITNCRLTAGSTEWDNYTYTLKARKVSGREGFLIMFHVRDRDNFIWWNIGGWGNTRSAIEEVTNGSNRQLGRAAGVVVDTGRWYDVRIEVAGPSIRCYLDDNLITDAVDSPDDIGVDPIFATASRDLASGDIIVKTVNVSKSPQELEVDLSGIQTVKSGSVTVISGNPNDVNSIAEPEKIAPRKENLTVKSGRFLHTFPAHSVSVMRLKIGK